MVNVLSKQGLIKIFIDPGHGGKDPEAVGNGLLEKNLTLKIAKRVKELLAAYENVEVKMSRTGDTYPTLSERAEAADAWGADFFLSIHINSASKTSTGYEDYIYTKASAKLKEYQKIIHAEIMKEIKGDGVSDRGLQQKNLQVLRATNMPALLTENLYISNPDEAAILKKAAFIEDVAQGHVNGIVKAFDLKKKKADDKEYHVVEKGDTVSKLAKEYDTTIAKIKDWNNLDSKYKIQIGQKLRVK
ncbi:MAG TPA: N-acetylmuramoyl-L-alanine amidase [Ureibacillus sp.]|uniref:N-acetylmuramoyl-L-alanine amidase family protein n=1 Tax=Peribacillus asahii TaxID=228899 RepID=UPI00207A9F4F|nr:N-acetylmuramoyl-L-alanine amidase [Peribacillus asahii]USK58140.1 N-acetylmuramoyl-L-alanine amidase [Peribacillus asahii]HWL26783.1 N-acetylmuramoyl-L-alanine amidase [Ureibacillus sp.]